jgi:hypothetical protein
MAKKTLLIVILIIFLTLPLLSAATTEIKVNTKPSHKLLITAQKAGTFPPVEIQSFAPFKVTGPLGEVKISLTTNEKTIDLKLNLITMDSAPDMNNLYTDLPTTGEPVFITFLPGNLTYTVGNPVVENITNTTQNSTLNETKLIELNNTPKIADNSLNITNKTILNFNFSITGFVSKVYNNNSKTITYVLVVIGIIVGILIIIFIVRKIPKKSKDNFTVSHRPITSGSSSQGISLIQAERKLKEAQAEIESIKKRNETIREAERKLKEDSIRLEKLKRGY